MFNDGFGSQKDIVSHVRKVSDECKILSFDPKSQLHKYRRRVSLEQLVWSLG